MINHSSKQRNTVMATRGLRNYNENDAAGNNHNRLSWPQFYYNRNRVSVNAGNGKSPEEQGRMSRRDSLGIGAPGNASTAVFDRVLCPDEARVMQRANQIVMYVPAQLQSLILLYYILYYGAGTYFSKKKLINKHSEKYIQTCMNNIMNWCWFFFFLRIQQIFIVILFFSLSLVSTNVILLFLIKLVSYLMQIMCRAIISQDA